MNIREGNSISPLETVSAKELLDTEFEPLRPIITRILPSGTFVYAGASKIGKSWMVLWIANQVSLGLPVWEFETTQCEVLYLSLEDTKRRLQQRLSEIADEVGTVHFATRAGLLGSGLEEQLVGFIKQYPNAKLIIIDTLEKVRNSQRDKHGYSDDYDVVGKIKEIGDTHNVTFLIVHHTRKEGDDDAVNTISGTNGIAGSADGIFILQKENRLENRANLLVVGRDVQTITLALEFDTETCKWSLIAHSDNDVTTAADPVLI
ncbi:MAG: AAA family ATPase, partial [Angelakisella sp.]